jgi:hypothetical protein
MYRAIRRTIATTAVDRPPDTNVVQLRRKPAPARSAAQQNQVREPEALFAAVSLGVVLVTILISLAMKLWVG